MTNRGTQAKKKYKKYPVIVSHRSGDKGGCQKLVGNTASRISIGVVDDGIERLVGKVPEDQRRGGLLQSLTKTCQQKECTIIKLRGYLPPIASKIIPDDEEKSPKLVNWRERRMAWRNARGFDSADAFTGTFGVRTRK